ncbi:hypothetical protein T31B1_01195 [Salinisphaera sp. T31B1]
MLGERAGRAGDHNLAARFAADTRGRGFAFFPGAGRRTAPGRRLALAGCWMGRRIGGAGTGPGFLFFCHADA